MMAIIHEVSGEPDKDGAQRCVLCGKVLAGEPGDRVVAIGGSIERPKVARFFPPGHVTEVSGEEFVGTMYVVGDDSGSPIPHVPCTELVPA